MVDVRQGLAGLRAEWESCRACNLGVRREQLKGPYIAGEGVERGIMFISGEGPTWEEEESGRAFTGVNYVILTTLLEKLGFNDYYITHLVPCRSCEPALDKATNLPRFRKQRNGPPLPIFHDQPPLPSQLASCQSRLFQEIYLVDPVLIVTLGVTAAEAVLQRHVTLSKETGSVIECQVPGGTMRPVLTDKKQVWVRKVHGEVTMPTEPNPITYAVLPTIHPGHARRKAGDLGVGSPIRRFGQDVRLAVKIYERYLVEALGLSPGSMSSPQGDPDATEV